MMSSDQEQVKQESGSAWLLSALFVVALLYIWISVVPFENLALPPVPSAAINQLVGAGLAMVLCLVAIRREIVPLLLSPRLWVFLVFAWLAFCSLLAFSPVTALQRLIFTFLLTLMMSIILLLPRDKQQFSRCLAAFSIALLSLCYLGVIFWQARAIHQPFDLGEPQLAGDWRGIFNHKNSAAPAMIMIFLIALFLRQSWSKLGGTLIALAALFFLYQTNGKTAALLLPVTLVLLWVFERVPRMTLMLLLTILTAMSVIVVGASFSPELRDFVEGLGVDATFTGRTDIWQLSMEMVPQSLLFGQGFQSYWNSPGLKSLEGFSDTWAIGAAHAHNAYIEALLNGGIPALLLVLIFLVLTPAMNFSRAMRAGADRDLNRLFGRLWLYAVLAACLESSFFTGNGAAWSSMLLAVFGLNMQANAELQRTDNLETH